MEWNFLPIEQRNLPPLFSPGMDHKEWEISRRDQILSVFQKEVFGQTPTDFTTRFVLLGEDPSACGGKAVRRRVRAEIFAPLGVHSFPFVVYIPKAKKPCPAFVLVCGADPDELPRIRPGFFPADQIVSRGYACAAFSSTGLDTDEDDGFVSSVAAKFEKDLKNRDASAWGTIGMWAFGMSRVADYLFAQPEIDPHSVSVVGHSRGGKTALWCGVQDKRIRCAFSNDSGCTGAALSRGNNGEQITDINTVFPYWLCKNYHRYNGHPERLPIDQHMLIALMAPRLAYIASASSDDWADPGSEFLGAVAASPVWEQIYGVKGLETSEHPGIEHPLHAGRVGYHMHLGGHGLTPYDWNRYMDFLEKHEQEKAEDLFLPRVQ